MNAATLLPPGNMYVHGTYRSGQWTFRPDRVVLVVDGGVDTASGRGKKYHWVTSIVTESSMCAGFRLSSDIASCLPLTSTVNVLAPHLMTM